MFFSKTTLVVILTLLTVSGCVTTASQEQQNKISQLESALNKSKKLTTKIQTKLDLTSENFIASRNKITELTTSFGESQTELSNALKNSQTALSVALRENIKNLEKNQVLATTPLIHMDDKTIFGQTEWVYLSKTKQHFKARIDTGASTSSINAINIEQFERDGEKWVRFSLNHNSVENVKNIENSEHVADPEIIEAKVVRTARIRQSNNAGESTLRIAIQLHIRIGDIAQLTEFTLTDRLHMLYPVLIGRTFMRDLILVDVSKKYSLPKYQAPVETKEQTPVASK